MCRMRDSSLSLCALFLIYNICLYFDLFSMSSYFDFDFYLIMCLKVSYGMSFWGIIPCPQINFSAPKCLILVFLIKFLVQIEIKIC